MRGVHLLPVLPGAAAAGGLILLAASRFRRTRWLVLGALTLILPVTAVLLYRFWDHYVGPDTFAFWRFHLSPSNMAFVLPLAALCPFLLWASASGQRGGRDNRAAAFSCFALSASLAAFLGDHIFMLALLPALATLFMIGAVMARGRGSCRFLSGSLVPLGLADLCLALGALFLYLSDPGRGLMFPASPLETGGLTAAACALMLTAALLRLGCLPFHRWMVEMLKGDRDLRLIHLLAVDLSLGAFILYNVTQVLYRWGGTWVWICLGVGAIMLLVVLFELTASSSREETLGLLSAAVGAHLIISASPGGQAASIALCLGLWTCIPALALVQLGCEGEGRRVWIMVLGGLALLGLPPLAGFAWRWMEFEVMAGEMGGGVGVAFLAVLAIVFAGALVEGLVSLYVPPAERREKTAPVTAVVAGALTVFLLGLGLYPGTLADLLMREYGFPLSLPFESWTALGWAMLLCSGVAAIALAAWSSREGGRLGGMRETWGQPLPLWRGWGFRLWPPPWLRGILWSVAAGALLYAGWAGIMIYLALK